MFFKKIALVILTAGFVSGILLQPASGEAKAADQTAEAVMETAVPDQSEEDSTSADPKEEIDTEEKAGGNNVTGTRIAVTTPAPVAATPQVVKVTKNISATSGKKTVKPKKKTVKKYTEAELRLMASIINCEAGGESYQGQVAVGIVVMNRVKSKLFPNSIRKVIYQRGQFSPVRNGSLRKKLSQYDAGRIRSAQWKSCIKAAKEALNGKTVIKLKGKTKSMKGVRFFSVYLRGAKFRLGGHRFR